jgi:hypothetical protein
VIATYRKLALLAALLVAVVSAGCIRGPLLQASSTASETLAVPVATGGAALRVRIEMFNGPVQVRAGARGEVTAVVTTTGVGATQGEAEVDRRAIAVTLDSNPDGTVLLRATYQPDPNSPGNRAAGAVVVVPGGADLDIRTSNGAVTVADAAGAIDVRTSNAGVTLAEASRGATVRTSNGAVEIAGGGLVDVEMANGRLTIRGTAASVRAVTSNGDLSFEGTFSPGPQDLATSNGSMTVRLPSGSAFALDAATSSGTVVVDGFEVRTTGAASRDTLQGTVGVGGPSIMLRTSNGAIVVSAT